MNTWLTLATLWIGAAYAGDPPATGEKADVETVTGAKLAPMVISENLQPAKREAEVNPYAGMPFERQAYEGAEQLDMPPEVVHGIREGLEFVYLRQYGDAKSHFREMEEKYPDYMAGMTHVASAVVWQAMMLENFDFRYDKQYTVSNKAAQKALTEALEKPGNEAWEHFMMTGMLGIEAIHVMRQERYLPALQLAFGCMDQAEKVRAHAPTFVDLQFADGMYNYWRTAVTMSSSVLPDFGDHRKEGLEQIQKVEQDGVFLGPVATLALAFTWVEERDFKRAAVSTSKGRQLYPDNIINNLVAGQVYTYQRKWDLANQAFDDIERVDADNDRVHYWRAVVHLKSGRPDDALASIDRYLSATHLEDWQIATANYRKGQIYERKREYGEAYAAYSAGAKANGHKGSKNAADRLKKRKREGKIDW